MRTFLRGVEALPLNALSSITGKHYGPKSLINVNNVTIVTVVIRLLYFT